MTKFEEEFNYLIELSGKVLIGQVDAEAFEKNRIAFFEKYETDQQQALPVVPECVAEWIESEDLARLIDIWYNHTNELPEEVREYFDSLDDDIININHLFKNITNLIARAKLDGYQVEKPQLFYIELPNVYGLSGSLFVSKVENGTILEFTKGKDYALALTEQEIKSIDERYWQFAVPVEDEE